MSTRRTLLLAFCLSGVGCRAAPRPLPEGAPERTAVLLLVDKSGSLAGEGIERMRAACAAAIRELRPGDVAAIMAFDSRPLWAIPFGRPDRDEDIEGALGRVEAYGGSDLLPALNEARIGFRSDPSARSARVRHVIVVSDGDVPPGDFEMQVRGLLGDGVTVSTICVGEGSDRFDAPLMSRIAEWGQGRFWFAANSGAVLALLTQETRRILGNKP